MALAEILVPKLRSNGDGAPPWQDMQGGGGGGLGVNDLNPSPTPNKQLTWEPRCSPTRAKHVPLGRGGNS